MMFDRLFGKKRKPVVPATASEINTIVDDLHTLYINGIKESLQLALCNSVANILKAAPLHTFEGRGAGHLRSNSFYYASYLVRLTAPAGNSYGSAIVEVELTTSGEMARFTFFTEGRETVRLVQDIYPYASSLLCYDRIHQAALAMGKEDFIKNVKFTALADDAPNAKQPANVLRFPGK